MSDAPKITSSNDLPEALVKHIQRDLRDNDKRLGLKGEHDFSYGGLRSIFNLTNGAQICRACGALNLEDAISCAKCNQQYEVVIYVATNE